MYLLYFWMIWVFGDILFYKLLIQKHILLFLFQYKISWCRGIQYCKFGLCKICTCITIRKSIYRSWATGKFRSMSITCNHANISQRMLEWDKLFWLLFFCTWLVYLAHSKTKTDCFRRRQRSDRLYHSLCFSQQISGHGIYWFQKKAHGFRRTRLLYVRPPVTLIAKNDNFTLQYTINNRPIPKTKETKQNKTNNNPVPNTITPSPYDSTISLKLNIFRPSFLKIRTFSQYSYL